MTSPTADTTLTPSTRSLLERFAAPRREAHVDIRPGSPRDAEAMSRFHYKPLRPATIARMLCARVDSAIVGVLCVSSPTLNAPWRELAWPDAFATRLSHREHAARVNALVRTISRVIVDPRYRGQSVARRLVEAYLASPLTTHTEALAAMGRFCPFFERAGMRRLDPPRTRRDLRLERTLRDLGVAPTSLLATTTSRRLLARRPELARAVLAWAQDNKSTRRHADAAPPEHLAALAGSSLCARPCVFVSP